MMLEAEFRNRMGDEAPLRICFVSSQYPPLIGGGIGRLTADLAQGFAAAGHDVHVVTTSGGWPTRELLEGVCVHRVFRRPANVITGVASEFLEHIALVYRAVLRLHQERPFDIVSSPVWRAEGLLVALDARFTSVISLHTSTQTLLDLKQDTEADLGLLTALEALCIEAHAHAHANSRTAVAKVTAEFSSPNRVVILPQGIQDQSGKFSRRRRSEESIRILVVGRQEERKGSDILARIIPGLLSTLPAIEFVLAGEQSPLRSLGSKILQQVLARKLRQKPRDLSRIEFASIISDNELYQHYADADILLFPSRYESFGLPLIEAMSFGIPVVATRAAGVSEVVVDNETGILVDLDNEAGLIEAVKTLAENAHLRNRYGREGRRRYLSHFSTAVSVPKTIAAYREVVRTGGALNATALVSDQSVLEKFAEVIQRVTPMRGDAATLAAKALIEGEPSGPSGVPKVSVIVTCYNYARYVTQALDSVAAQTHSNFECVVVDDASTDGSPEVIARWIAQCGDGRFKLIRNEENFGQMRGFAIGLQATSGEFVAFLDADDFWFERYLEHHADVLQNAGPVAATSCSDLVQVDENGRVLSGCFTGGFLRARRGALVLHQEDLGDDLAAVFGQAPLGSADVQYIHPGFTGAPWNVTSGIVFRRSTLEAIMPADPDKLRLCADGYIFSLCHMIAGSYWTSSALSAYRRHGKNGFGFLPMLGTKFISPEDSVSVFQSAIFKEMLERLLDPGRNLDAMLTTPRRRRLVRQVFRALLASGERIDERKIAAVLGWSRVSRDWLRSRLVLARRTG
jgi:glycosyltransferase involved in cell wall biosynthesis